MTRYNLLRSIGDTRATEVIRGLAHPAGEVPARPEMPAMNNMRFWPRVASEKAGNVLSDARKIRIIRVGFSGENGLRQPVILP